MATTTTFAIASPTATPPNGTVPFTSTDYCDLKRAGLWSGPIPDQGPSSLAAIWALFAAATIFVSLRFYCKVWRHKGLWWDDLFMGLSWVSSFPCCHSGGSHSRGSSSESLLCACPLCLSTSFTYHLSHIPHSVFSASR